MRLAFQFKWNTASSMKIIRLVMLKHCSINGLLRIPIISGSHIYFYFSFPFHCNFKFSFCLATWKELYRLTGKM